MFKLFIERYYCSVLSMFCSIGGYIGGGAFLRYILGLSASLFGFVAGSAEGNASCDAVCVSVPAIFLG
jgi:hypothetical protein